MGNLLSKQELEHIKDFSEGKHAVHHAMDPAGNYHSLQAAKRYLQELLSEIDNLKEIIESKAKVV